MDSGSIELRKALQLVAPGTALREGLERIQRSHTGALIILGYTPEIEALCSGGFELEVPFSPARLRELCKMDGAVVIDSDTWMIRKANVQLIPDPTIPTNESGMRHRTAQRVARQTNIPVLSLSASMRLISIYVGKLHHTVEEPETLLARANQAVDTLERYSQRLDEVLASMAIFEMREAVTVRDIATVVQRMEMIRRITSEIDGFLSQLGDEGRLLSLQVDDLLRGAASERALVLRDYVADPSMLEVVEERLAALSGESLVDLAQIAESLGMSVYDPADLDEVVRPRGIRALAVIPRLPWRLIQQISDRWPTLSDLRELTAEDFQQIEGIGPYRAQTIVDHLRQRANAASNPNLPW
ncbi:DNA integrity scanning diadenylate cyclase DisA [Actinomyces minihominis]|uniref:DNA integrity scanning diadenylate cyclase DisA n=1 Tax=Actinomyces minihominis TaxID=2002838 RepID=UPI000C06B675|nr:DNA integrity scanning diadenylate cyclase DisA [Actinomyces minihominis]